VPRTAAAAAAMIAVVIPESRMAGR
jgi:hypothetical protein